MRKRLEAVSLGFVTLSPPYLQVSPRLSGDG